MRDHLKFLLSLIVIASLVFACSKKSTKDQQTTQTQQQQPEPERKDQYRIAEMYSGSRQQIIDLIEGTATFDIEHKGDSTFTAKLLNSDGTLVVVLADVRGNYKGTKTITAPKTSAYILDVRTTGTWSVYRK